MGLRTCIILLCCAGIYIQFVKARTASYLGCFKDDKYRMFDDPRLDIGYQSDSMTVDMCISYCRSRQHVYSGVQYSVQCYCGDNYPNRNRYPRVSDGDCNKGCIGFVSEKCGSDWRQSVYRDCSILSLPHCKEIGCYSTNNKWCTKCSNKLLYKIKQQRCHETCSWVDRWCWPGSCPDDFTSSCSCMQGFRTVTNNSTYARCQPTLQPSIESCQARAIGRNGSGGALSHVGSSECSLQKHFFGRFQVEQFSVALQAHFIVNIEDEYKKQRPGFVKEEHFGVLDVDVLLQKVSLTGSRTNVSRELVKTDIQSKNPTRYFTNDNVIISNRENLTDGEKLCLIYNIYGGGYLVSKNMISLVESNISYDKTKQSKEICYIYDRTPPVHCIQTGSCVSRGHEPLKLSRRLTKSKLITVNIEGWHDPYPMNGHQSLASGIDMFEINIYEVTQSTPPTLMRDTKTVGNYTLEPNVTEVEITLPDKNPMLYVIFLEVKDRAKNVRQARRFVLFDQSSVILKNNRIPFKVTSASIKANMKWQINNEKLCFSWKGRFYNNGSRKNNLLRPVKLEDRIHGKYDQIDGPLSVNGTQNVNGITGYRYTLEKNNINTALYGTVSNFLSESICLATDLKDGDIFTFILQAIDIMNNTLNDSVSINIDTSVPEITDIWLVRDGQEQIYVHHSADLSLMTIKFKSFDIHSGLREVKWTFGVYENKTVLIEKAVGITAMNTVDGCVNNTDCYCPIIGNCSTTTYVADLTKLKTDNKHTGNHNRRYFFTIKVINAAQLVAIEHIDILVDESPPETGRVLEGPMGSLDIDYTSFDDITVHWHDFIDHESGIKFYRIALGRECFYDLKNISPGPYNDSIVQESSHNSLKTVFPDGVGQYFVTVIAYNYAMSPSKPVCSDGITSCSGSSSDSSTCAKQPTVVFVVCQTTSATVLWKPEMNGASTQTFFVKFWSPSQSSQATLTPAISDPGSDADVQHIINNLVPETIYIFQIITRNLFGDSLSKPVNCTTNERQYLTSPTSSDQSGLFTAGIACLIISLLSVIFVVSFVVYWRFRLQKRTPMRNNDYTEYNTCNPRPVVTDQYDILNTTNMGTNDKSKKQTDRNIHTYEECQPSNNTDHIYQNQTIQSTGTTKKKEYIYDNMKI